jgi:hypothetical protein
MGWYSLVQLSTSVIAKISSIKAMFYKPNICLPSVLLAVGSALLFAPSGNAQEPTIATIQNLTTGDRACYVDILDAGGVASTQYADFEICERDLVGKDVQLTYESANIPAASCEGNPDCDETETVMLITQAEVIEPPLVGTVQSITEGNTLCDIGFTDEAGELWYREATVEVCSQDLVDETVQFTYEVMEIPAYACEGDPTCDDINFVTLVTDVEVLTDAATESVDGMMREPIQLLPDGNYRYWNGTPEGAIVSDEELLANGGVTFMFRKQGNDITGIFGYVDGEAICVQGQINGNTISGISVQTLRGATVLSAGDTFQSFGPSGYLRVRRGQQISPSVVRYSSTLLDLGELNRINAGTRVPPSGC